jgi:RimJ/RimL family protein N-acetyltransferase
MNIKGKKVILRAVERKDLEFLHKWGNNPELQYTMGNVYFPSSRDFHERWYEKIQGDSLNQRLAIEAPDVGFIGLSSLIDIDWKNNRAWHGIMLGDKDTRGKGYGFDAVMATMRYAFDEMHLERLDGQMIEYNTHSIDFYCDKLGWKKEGVARNWFYSKGTYWDKIMVGITRQDYLDLLEKTNYWEKE